MKNKKVKRVIYCLIGMVLAALLIMNCYTALMTPLITHCDNDSDPLKKDNVEKLRAVGVDDIDYVMIEPLLSGWSSRLTIKNKIKIDNFDIIQHLLSEMRCYRTASELAGRWWADRQLKMIYYLKTKEELSFQLSFHVNQDVVNYYELPQDELFNSSKYYSNCGSKKLYDILLEIIEKNNVEFVHSEEKKWHIGDGLEYIGDKH